MIARLTGYFAKLLIGEKLTQASQVAVLGFLERLVWLVHCGAAAGIAQLRDDLVAGSGTDRTSKESELDQRRLTVARMAAELETEKRRQAEADLQLQDKQLDIAKKKSDLEYEQARREIDLATERKRQETMERLCDLLTNLRMKGGGIGLDPKEIQALIDQQRKLLGEA
jgi:hypothetical protein